jgi:hypothetical protein
VRGDLIAVRANDGIRAHRLLNTIGSHWITRGDAMPQDDPAICPEQVLGVVSHLWRGQRMIIPQRRLRPVARGLAWLLGFSLVCRITLRFRSAWIHRARQAKTTQLRGDELAL